MWREKLTSHNKPKGWWYRPIKGLMPTNFTFGLTCFVGTRPFTRDTTPPMTLDVDGYKCDVTIR